MKNSLVMAALLMLAACAAPQPRFDYDKKADFAHLHSFAWLGEDPLFQPGDGDKAVSLLNRRRIVDEIEAGLLAKGFVKAPSGAAADLLVVYSVGTRERIESTGLTDLPMHPWFWGWPYYGRDLDVRSYVEGHLAIDVLEGAARRPIWHGVSRESLTETDLEQAGDRIPRAVSSLLQQFPPH